MAVRVPVILTLLLWFAGAAPALAATTDDDVGNEYRLTASTHHELMGNFTGFGQFEYRNNPDQDYQTYEALWPGVIYSVEKWLQLSGGLASLYTVNEHKADTLELRPFAGVKLFLPNKFKWNIYNYSRYEFRDTQSQKTYDWTSYSRVRSRFGVEFPLVSRERAWEPKTWYGLADVEPVYRFDHDKIDPLYVRGGIAYIFTDRLRLEFIYTAEFTRPTTGSSLQLYDNIIQLNFRIGLAKGIIGRLRNPNVGE